MDQSRYADMVCALFKNTGYDRDFDGLAHAVIGMVGEAAEAANHDSYENLLEELGDFEFYRQAAFTELVVPAGMVENSVVYLEANAKALIDIKNSGVMESGMSNPVLAAMLLSEVLHRSIDVLDITKKLWVYRKPFAEVSDKLLAGLGGIDAYLAMAYTVIGVTREQMRHGNFVKLSKRYPLGVYSDQHAQARADKENADE